MSDYESIVLEFVAVRRYVPKCDIEVAASEGIETGRTSFVLPSLSDYEVIVLELSPFADFVPKCDIEVAAN